MDPLTITVVSEQVIKQLPKLIGDIARRRLASEAKDILATRPESSDHVRAVLGNAKSRLRTTWVLGIGMTVTLFVLFAGMAVVAVAVGLILKESVYPIVFGGVSVASLLTTVIWKPYEKSFEAAITTQRLEMILVGLEEEWASCSKMDDPVAQNTCIRAANKAALDEIAKLS